MIQIVNFQLFLSMSLDSIDNEYFYTCIHVSSTFLYEHMLIQRKVLTQNEVGELFD